MPSSWDHELGFAIGDNMALRIGGVRKFYKVTNRDTLFLQETYDAIAADSTSSYAEVTNLNPPHGQIFQIAKIWLDGNVKLFLKMPSSTNRWGTQRSPSGGFITDKTSGLKGGLMLNIFCTIDNVPSVQLVNEQNIEIQPKVWFIGWRYAIQSIPEPQHYDEISITGISQ